MKACLGGRISIARLHPKTFFDPKKVDIQKPHTFSVIII